MTTPRKGNDLVLQAASVATGSAYSTIAALTNTTITMNRQQVDVTNKDEAGWLSYIDSAREVTIAGEGIFKNVSAQTIMFNVFDANTPWNFRALSVSAFSLTGAFQLESLEFQGEVNGRQQYSFSLKSDGAITRVTL